ncbi:uncharacterized protein LOC123405336, partial [Hordeum vulgare subsp. vulgare]|uniref:uncharacterized protein LOC123405336 n=1 Tax=Hordeum vulgare subsp. vulgare TaxID=112509 RepID=UPI001D1A4E60
RTWRRRPLGLAPARLAHLAPPPARLAHPPYPPFQVPHRSSASPPPAQISALAPVVAGLTGLGLSRPDIARFVSLADSRFRYTSVVSKMHYYLPLFGSLDSIRRALRRSSYLLSSDLDKVINPNVVFLRECGLGDCDIAKL